MTHNDAHIVWYNAGIQKDMRVYNIIQSLIDSPQGIMVLINRPKQYSYWRMNVISKIHLFVVGPTYRNIRRKTF